MIIVKTLLELLGAALLILGFVYEDKIIEFEERMLEKIKRLFKSESVMIQGLYDIRESEDKTQVVLNPKLK